MKILNVDGELTTFIGTGDVNISTLDNKDVTYCDVYNNGDRVGKVFYYVYISKTYVDNDTSGKPMASKRREGSVYSEMNQKQVPPGFRFRKLGRRINWDRIRSLNLERVTYTADAPLLLTCLDDVATGDVSQEDVDPRFHHTVQLAQYATQYLLACQEMFIEKEKILNKALDCFVEEEEHIDVQISKLRARNKALQREHEDVDDLHEQYLDLLKVLSPDMAKKFVAQEETRNKKSSRKHKKKSKAPKSRTDASTGSIARRSGKDNLTTSRASNSLNQRVPEPWSRSVGRKPDLENDGLEEGKRGSPVVRSQENSPLLWEQPEHIRSHSQGKKTQPEGEKKAEPVASWEISDRPGLRRVVSREIRVGGSDHLSVHEPAVAATSTNERNDCADVESDTVQDAPVQPSTEWIRPPRDEYDPSGSTTVRHSAVGWSTGMSATGVMSVDSLMPVETNETPPDTSICPDKPSPSHEMPSVEIVDSTKHTSIDEERADSVEGISDTAECVDETVRSNDGSIDSKVLNRDEGNNPNADAVLAIKEGNSIDDAKASSRLRSNTNISNLSAVSTDMIEEHDELFEHASGELSASVVVTSPKHEHHEGRDEDGVQDFSFDVSRDMPEGTTESPKHEHTKAPEVADNDYVANQMDLSLRSLNSSLDASRYLPEAESPAQNDEELQSDVLRFIQHGDESPNNATGGLRSYTSTSDGDDVLLGTKRFNATYSNTLSSMGSPGERVGHLSRENSSTVNIHDGDGTYKGSSVVAGSSLSPVNETPSVIQWTPGRAPLELVETANALDVFVSAVRFDNGVFTSSKVYLQIDFMDALSPISDAIQTNVRMSVIPVSYASYIAFNRESSLLLAGEIGSKMESLSLTIQILEATDEDRQSCTVVGDAIVDLW
eukprot:CAMPEP_0185028984 /NCGR_PEP_ID=MMETSP1103-20130426/15084_1 /TAXON_ID=36769 /ORGANISM="Paraphysomonas bandaiensis, Strain Caron Lab Isolate" /LENGTH=891 /DNA_ID=CAMNT_0027563583 /DNA_START=330 /DNA_END=3002 /DNA_ORIENTATION=+